jgi:hypothetical protein
MSLKKSKSFHRRRQFSILRKKNERSEVLNNNKSSASLAVVEDNSSNTVSPIEAITPLPKTPAVEKKEGIEETTDLFPGTTETTHQIEEQQQEEKRYTESTTTATTATATVVDADILDPAQIFPYSNKPHEPRKKTIAEESKQWESLFDPQYTFGSFQHGIAKPVQNMFYKGKWPLDQEDVMGMVFKPKSQSAAGASTANSTPMTSEEQPSTVLFPVVPNPTLPDLKQLQLHINTSLLDQEEEDGDNNFRQIEILPCPSLSQFPKYKLQENEAALWKDRLELLNSIQISGFNKELNDGTQSNPYKESAAARLQRQITIKAEQIKRETLMDSDTDEEDQTEEEEQQDVHINIEPDALLLTLYDLEEPSEEQQHETADHSSLANLDDEYENISFHAPKEEGDIEKEPIITIEPEVKRKNRATFLLFAYGFLLPPLWIVGALYVPSSKLQRTSASKNIDKKWKKYSRNAFFTFMVLVVSILVLILMLRPQAVGFRNSNEEDYQKEERVVFDEEPAALMDPINNVVV